MLAWVADPAPVLVKPDVDRAVRRICAVIAPLGVSVTVPRHVVAVARANFTGRTPSVLLSLLKNSTSPNT